MPMVNVILPNSTGMIIRQKEPNNLETPLDQVDSYLTPTELFYIRSHFTAPKLEHALYRLRIGGAVNRPEVQPRADARDYLAEDRTFLAWIRTALP